jgi:hypothetical protein
MEQPFLGNSMDKYFSLSSIAKAKNLGKFKLEINCMECVLRIELYIS